MIIPTSQNDYATGFADGYRQGKKDAERKGGRWIKVNGKTAINCSACYHCSWSLSFEDTVKRFNFCPNCGADMRGEEDETAI